MLRQELIHRILILVPTASCSVWDEVGDYFGETVPKVQNGFRIDWRGPGVCPTEEELNAVTDAQVVSWTQKQQDGALYNQYKDDVIMKTMYRFEKQQNPSLTYIEFLKSMDNMKV